MFTTLPTDEGEADGRQNDSAFQCPEISCMPLLFVSCITSVLVVTCFSFESDFASPIRQNRTAVKKTRHFFLLERFWVEDEQHTSQTIFSKCSQDHPLLVLVLCLPSRNDGQKCG